MSISHSLSHAQRTQTHKHTHTHIRPAAEIAQLHRTDAEHLHFKNMVEGIFRTLRLYMSGR